MNPVITSKNNILMEMAKTLKVNEIHFVDVLCLEDAQKIILQ